MPTRVTRWLLLATLLTIPIAAPPASDSPTTLSAQSQPAIPFTRHEIDGEHLGIREVGDIDGDGYPDIVARNELGSELPVIVWYAYPDWTRHVLGSAANYRSDDLELADMDADGDLDLVLAIDEPGQVYWLENPRPAGNPAEPWPARHVAGTTPGGGGYVKDLEVQDFDADGRPDIAARTNRHVYVFAQDGPIGGPAGWRQLLSLAIPDHEGMSSGDLDGDGDTDLLLNGFWLERPDEPAGAWPRHEIDPRWYTQSGTGWQDNNAKLLVVDMDRDGRQDALICHSEREGFPISWYHAENPRGGPWTEEVVVERYDYCHTLQAGDIDLDGDVDIVTGQMPKASDPDEIAVLRNRGNALGWDKEIIATSGIYHGVLGDIGADGDLDLVGCRNWDQRPIELYENRTVEPGPPLERWTYIQVDDARAKWGDFDEPAFLKYFGLAMGDLDGDGDDDIASGRYAYQNPGGDMHATWPRLDLGANVDAMLITDVDGDDRADLIAEALPDVLWLEAEQPDLAGGSWRTRAIASIPPTGHRNSQGYALGDVSGDGRPEILLGAGDGIHAIGIPPEPETGQPWPAMRIAAGGVGAVAPGDIDRDGHLDLASIVDGSGGRIAWWRNPGDGSGDWPRFELGGIDRGYADRVEVGDLDGDGRLDVVVTEEDQPEDAVYGTFWFQQPDDPISDGWPRRTIALQSTTNSLDLADMDGDGDLDVVTGEHRGAERVTVWENRSGAAEWTPHGVGQGHESHLGARAADLDADGDLDLVSIAWDDYRFLHLWRNDARRGGSVPPPGPTPLPMAAAPVFAPAEGIFGDPVQLRMHSDTPGASIHYELDPSLAGRIPDEDSPRYQGPVHLTDSVLVDARSFAPGHRPSPVARGRYLILEPGQRAEGGLLALYRFDEGAGATVHDRSGRQPAIDLTIEAPESARWASSGPGLALHGPNRIRSAGAATRVNEAIGRSGALTLEAWITPSMAEQEGPARIVSLSLDSGTRNISLGHGLWGDQPRTVYDLRLRTSITDPNGSDSLTTPAGSVRAGLQHVLFTRAAEGQRRFYIDAELVAEDQLGGDLSTWDPSYPLLLANELEVDRPWLGSFHLVALYDRALSPAEVAQNFGAGPALVPFARPDPIAGLHLPWLRR